MPCSGLFLREEYSRIHSGIRILFMNGSILMLISIGGEATNAMGATLLNWSDFLFQKLYSYAYGERGLNLRGPSYEALNIRISLGNYSQIKFNLWKLWNVSSSKIARSTVSPPYNWSTQYLILGLFALIQSIQQFS